MIKFTLDGESVGIPSRWSDLTVRFYKQILDAKSDIVKLIALFTGMDEKRVKKVKIIGMERLFEAISFLNSVPDFTVMADKIGPYKIPKDVTIESLGQFEDLRALSKNMPEKPLPEYTLEDTKSLIDLYVSACAIYCQKVRDKEYDFDKAKAMESEIWDYPCDQVLSAGAFFLVKPLALLNSTRKNSRPQPSKPKKRKRASKS